MRIVLMLFCSIVLASCSSAPAAVDEQAPHFTLSTLTGEELSLADVEGKRVMLNFWATWCAPCREEMSHMQQAYDESDVAIIAINRTDQDYGAQRVQSFVEEFGFTFPIVLDETGEVAKQYGVITIPTTIFIDEAGNVIERISGPVTAEQIDSYMQ